VQVVGEKWTDLPGYKRNGVWRKSAWDTLFALIYDENWGASIAPTHAQFLGQFLKRCPPHGLILDAACGTGKYWPLILASGLSIFGMDQSQGMLARAQAKFPDVRIEKMGMQEMRYQGAFDGAICMDAMEMVFPEDWRLVLENVQRALKPSSYFYFTVELAGENETAKAFAAGRELGLPVVYGEWAHEGGYHYYPRIEQVRDWVRLARFRLVEETVGDEYHHFLVSVE
jgi:SAM-dependent methyltransferase